ncbi:MAG: ABC transporter ATP-binding protein [Methanomicrobiales archaeon]|nr:ABC transporter ATP-binding protein [Methanomicrobiales archaeon]
MSESTSAPVVEISEVSKSYGYVQALREVSLEIERGEFIAFFGHNGAGKTTLLKIIATHLHPSSGDVRIFGHEVSAKGPQIRGHIGLVTHENYLYPELSVRENLHFYARLFSIDDEGIYQDLIDYFELRRWYDVGVGKLSFGLKKRADIVRALLHNPDLILLDEPFAGLDTHTCTLLADHFTSQKEAGKTVLISSHSREWMEKICERTLVFEKGKIVRDIPCG